LEALFLLDFDVADLEFTFPFAETDLLPATTGIANESKTGRIIRIREHCISTPRVTPPFILHSPVLEVVAAAMTYATLV
jgi:hypothetical protein